MSIQISLALFPLKTSAGSEMGIEDSQTYWSWADKTIESKGGFNYIKQIWLLPFDYSSQGKESVGRRFSGFHAIQQHCHNKDSSHLENLNQ